MSYAYWMTVDQPKEMYERVTADIGASAASDPAPGRLVHMAAKTSSGFHITEVWTSEEVLERYQTEVRIPAINRVAKEMGIEMAGRPERHQIALLGLVVDTQSHSTA